MNKQVDLTGKAVTLEAYGLYAKWGFGDGDILDEAIYDMSLEHDCDFHGVLCALVEEKLLPLLPFPVETFRILTCHNPIRVEDKHHNDGSKQANDGFSVDVTYEEIRAYVAKVKP